MLLGRETKRFPLRFKCSKEEKQPMSLGIDKRSRSLRCKYVKDWIPDKEDNNGWVTLCMETYSELVWCSIMAFTWLAEINKGLLIRFR